MLNCPSSLLNTVFFATLSNSSMITTENCRSFKFCNAFISDNDARSILELSSIRKNINNRSIAVWGELTVSKICRYYKIAINGEMIKPKWQAVIK